MCCIVALALSNAAGQLSGVHQMFRAIPRLGPGRIRRKFNPEEIAGVAEFAITNDAHKITFAVADTHGGVLGNSGFYLKTHPGFRDILQVNDPAPLVTGGVAVYQLDEFRAEQSGVVAFVFHNLLIGGHSLGR